jgi:U4/U6.U5 tri-snRNP-associated protein 1
MQIFVTDTIDKQVVDAEDSPAGQNADVGTSSEQTFSSGMASTINILRQQGIPAALSADQVDRERTQLQRDFWLANQRRRIAQQEMERLQSRGANKDQNQTQREYENRLREQRSGSLCFVHWQ